MQLNKESRVAKYSADRGVRDALVAATCGLLGQSAPAAAGTDPGDWQFDTALLFYSETDRVTAIEPVVSGRRYYEDDAFLDMKLVLDALTGASANGAVPSSQPETYTRPSGNGFYTTPAGETPLDDTFHDTRGAFSVSWSQPLNPDWKMTVGGNLSKEYDFQSLGANILLSRDFNKRNTTLSMGASFEADSIDPVGGQPNPLTRMITGPKDGVEAVSLDPYVDTDDIDSRDSGDSKTIVDLLFGVTQVLNRNALLQVNYSYSNASGYQTDPYKLVSVIDAAAGPLQGDPLYHVYESRPDKRSKHALYVGTKYWLGGDILDASYRYLTDDWGINSHTADVRYRFDLGNDSYLQPHFRYYTQTAADFYHRALRNDQALPQDYVTADYRLGDLDGITVGLEYGIKLSSDSEFTVRAELYQQSGDVADPGVKIGTQQAHDLFPDVDAYIIQFGYKFNF